MSTDNSDGAEGTETNLSASEHVAPGPGERKRRRNLTPDEQRQLAHMYVDPNVSTAEIRERFGVGDSTLYRVIQKYGVGLRGRGAAAAGGAAGGVRNAVQSRTPARAGKPAKSSVERQKSVSVSRDGGRQRFVVHFNSVRVFEARDVHDALRQAESAGATGILEITRES